MLLSPKHNYFFLFSQAKIYQLAPTDVDILEEIGDGKYGKVWKAQIMSNLQYCPGEPVRSHYCYYHASYSLIKNILSDISDVCFSDLQKSLSMLFTYVFVKWTDLLHALTV